MKSSSGSDTTNVFCFVGEKVTKKALKCCVGWIHYIHVQENVVLVGWMVAIVVVIISVEDNDDIPLESSVVAISSFFHCCRWPEEAIQSEGCCCPAACCCDCTLDGKAPLLELSPGSNAIACAAATASPGRRELETWAALAWAAAPPAAPEAVVFAATECRFSMVQSKRKSNWCPRVRKRMRKSCRRYM